MCLDHVGQLTRSNPWRTKRGGEHHITTDHGPMVQGRLLTDHPGSVHDGGEAPGGQSSLRQGAGKRSAGAPDLGSKATAEHRRDRKKGFYLPRFPVTENLLAKGASQGANRGPGGPLARPHPRARREGAWGSGGGPLAPLYLFRKLPIR